MEKKNSCARAGFSTILWGVVAILLCAAPCVWGVVYYDDGEEHDILEDVPDSLEILNGTVVNLYASVSGSIFVHPGSYLNIYSGVVDPEMFYYVGTSPDEPNAVVTVYGTDFHVGNTYYDTPTSVTISDGILQGKYGDESPINLWFMSDVPIFLAAPPDNGVKEVAIDIKPGSDLNPINPGSNGLIPVAILTTADFDAATVDPESVSLAGAEVAVRGKAEKLMARLEDVDGDGDLDLLVQVETQSDGALWKSGTVTLTGKTYDGQDIKGTDEVIIVPPEG